MYITHKKCGSKALIIGEEPSRSIDGVWTKGYVIIRCPVCGDINISDIFEQRELPGRPFHALRRTSKDTKLLPWR